MKTEIKKVTDEFVGKLLQIIQQGNLKDLAGITFGDTKGKPRGMAALSTKERSVVAKKAAATRKRRLAGKKGKPRGMAALSAEQRSVVALKAAATRKRRAAGRRAAETRKQNA